MASDSSTASRNRATNSRSSQEADVKRITQDITEYLTDYARQNPSAAALWCLGIGFVLGWKLKPW